MNQKIYLLPLFLLALVFTSCNETKEYNQYHNWRERNEAFMDSLLEVIDSKSDPMLHSTTDDTNKEHIFFKKIKGEEYKTSDVRPTQNSKVNVFYRGMLINEEVFGAAPSPRFYTRLYKELTVFDKNFPDDDPDKDFDLPNEFEVSGLISGWTKVLQWMYPGERWEVYIPWQSAYGDSKQGSIPAYSALVFDIELVEITEK